ncbi:MAG: four helix bundle protein [Bacteroidales bacterium]|jgi:four helix bundle protein|nr:four helix bundle protein [Bacteroidales bacterium]
MYGNYKNLKVYLLAMEQAMDIFNITKSFPKEEKYSLTDQIRRSSRSICASVGEAYRKRQYPAHFASKLSDADMENTETQIWLEFAARCEYISQNTKCSLLIRSQGIGKLLNYMILHPEKYQRKNLPDCQQ